jgi:hypothetical protein
MEADFPVAGKRLFSIADSRILPFEWFAHSLKSGICKKFPGD